jgi:transketolase
MEGLSHEAIALAGHLKLAKLILLWDDNGITIDGEVSLADSTDQLTRFTAAGWNAVQVDGHDPEAVSAAIEAARTSDRPSMIACKTTIGYGAPTKAGTHSVHGAALGKDEIAGARQKLVWTAAPFEIPAPIADAWKQAAQHASSEHAAWKDRLAAKDPAVKEKFEFDISGRLAPEVSSAVEAFKRKASESGAAQASRISSQNMIGELCKAQPNLLGGSADLTGSNNTKGGSMKSVSRDDFSGNYLHYGIREFGMAAAMNGIALHKGFIPFGGTFLVFADYCRPALRLAALMGQRVIHVMTHDSIGLGEDGPTHQPVETIASLRAIPNLLVFRPADAVETAEVWELALQSDTAPSILCLSRQNLPLQRREHVSENLSAKGAYILREADGERALTLFATGSEVSLATEAATRLGEKGIKTAVVSIPCFELFAKQPLDYRRAVIGNAPRIGVEAAIRQGWDLVLGPEDDFVGMSSFGASAPASDLFKKFGITVDAIVAAALARLQVAA